jgi:hypothetical protein
MHDTQGAIVDGEELEEVEEQDRRPTASCFAVKGRLVVAVGEFVVAFDDAAGEVQMGR